MAMSLTPEIINAAGRDAGMRNMERHGRSYWIEEDFDAAQGVVDGLWDAYLRERGMLLPN